MAQRKCKLQATNLESLSVFPMKPDRLLRASCAAVWASCLAACGQLSAELHDPRNLPALEQDHRVHYEPGTDAYAREVARLLPASMAKVEAAQGRPFGKDFVVVTFQDNDSYAAFNGRGSAIPPAVTHFDRVTLSPALWGTDRRWLDRDLTHELSHEHFFGHLSALAYYRIPIWFIEGIAVMVSEGGGAADVTDQDGQIAICAGRAIPVTDEPGWFDNFSLKAQPPAPPGEDLRTRMHMAYRQAGMFVSYLNSSDPVAFKSLLDRLYAGERFKPATEAVFHASLAQEWQGFVGQCGSRWPAAVGIASRPFDVVIGAGENSHSRGGVRSPRRNTPLS